MLPLARLAPARVVARPTLCVKSRRGVTGVSIADATGGTRPAFCFPYGPIPVGPRVRFPIAPNRAVGPEAVTAAVTTVDAFGVSAEQWELIEGNLFGASLLPYLVFLYYLGMPESKMPPRALFGFKFLLVFVFGTIPCAIYAKLVYNDILANVDWLHGPAESLLTITNLLIVIGLREGLRDVKGSDGGKRSKVSSVSGALLGWSAAATTATLAAVAAGAGGGVGNVAEAAESAASIAPAVGDVAASFFRHAEPANALSLPTWVIHVSSLIEWLVAMGLIWEYADATGNQKYKGLTWGMVPCHASGIAACTFHLFYNSPALNSVVATQAGLTVLGNTTIAIAAYRIAIEGGAKNTLPWEEGFVAPWKKNDPIGVTTDAKLDEVGSEDFAANIEEGATAKEGGLAGWEDLGKVWAGDSDLVLILKLALVSTVVSAAVKWGSLEVDFPFEPSVWLAFTLIFGPTALNMIKWQQISAEESAAR